MTKIGAAYRLWAELWRTYPTDEESDAANAARNPLLDTIAEEPATSLADAICKLKVVHEMSGWKRERETIAGVIACLERLARGT
jgi:hypothetical protein